MTDRQHGAAMSKCLVNGEIETGLDPLEARAVERTIAFLERRAPARGAAVRRAVGALLEQQQVDAAVRCRLERARPAGRRAAVATRFLAPALDRLRLVLRLRLHEYGLDRFEQLRRRRMRLRAHRADDRVARFLRQLFHELAPRVLGAHEHDLRRMQTPATPVELLRDPLQVFLDELLDVPLVARLRPPALVMPAVLLIELICDRLETSGEQSIQLALLAADDGDDRPVHPRDEGNERSEIELTSRANAVGDRLGKGERVPVVVERGRE